MLNFYGRKYPRKIKNDQLKSLNDFEFFLDKNKSNIISNPKSLDISFPDRYSISLIDAKSYLELENKLNIKSIYFLLVKMRNRRDLGSPSTQRHRYLF